MPQELRVAGGVVPIGFSGHPTAPDVSLRPASTESRVITLFSASDVNEFPRSSVEVGGQTNSFVGTDRTAPCSICPTATAHSIIHGTAYEPTPWAAVRSAAWEALNRPEAAYPPRLRTDGCATRYHGGDSSRLRGLPDVQPVEVTP